MLQISVVHPNMRVCVLSIRGEIHFVTTCKMTIQVNFTIFYDILTFVVLFLVGRGSSFSESIPHVSGIDSLRGRLDGVIDRLW